MDNRTIEEVRKNETKLIEEIKSLEKQLEYLRSGEYYNQLRFENEMLQQVVDTNGVPSEVYDYIDCTHRNTELLEENKKYKEVIDKAIEYIESKNNGVCVINGKEKEAFTFLLDFDKAREFIWGLLDILKEVE